MHPKNHDPFLSLLALLALLTLLVPRSLKANTFVFSRAPVSDDPSLDRGANAKNWPHINLGEARRLLDNDGVVFVDCAVRPAWAKERISGSLSLPAERFQKNFPALESRLRGARILICTCRDTSCACAEAVARLLAKKGLRNLAVFPGGLSQWKAAGFPLEGTGIPRQVSHPFELPGAR